MDISAVSPANSIIRLRWQTSLKIMKNLSSDSTEDEL